MPCRNVSGSDLGRTALWKGDLSKRHAPALQKTDCVPLRRPYRNASRAIGASPCRFFEVLGLSTISLSGLRDGGKNSARKFPHASTTLDPLICLPTSRDFLRRSMRAEIWRGSSLRTL